MEKLTPLLVDFEEILPSIIEMFFNHNYPVIMPMSDDELKDLSHRLQLVASEEILHSMLKKCRDDALNAMTKRNANVVVN